MINLALIGQYYFEQQRSKMILPVVQIMAQLQEGVLDDNDAMGAQAEEKADEAVDEAEEGSKRFAALQTQLRRLNDSESDKAFYNTL